MSENTQDGIDLDAIRARAEAATEGPWKADRFFWKHMDRVPDDWWYGIEDAAGYLAVTRDDAQTSGPNTEFLAHARTDVPLLLAAVAERDAEIEQIAAMHKASAQSARDYWQEVERLTAVLGAVAALADDLDREAKMLGGQPERTRSHIASRLRAVLAPVSGAVEDAGEEREPSRVPTANYDNGFMPNDDDRRMR